MFMYDVRRTQGVRGPKWDERGAKWDERGPKWDERGPKWDERGPKWDERGPKWDERGPKWDERGWYPEGGQRSWSPSPRDEAIHQAAMRLRERERANAADLPALLADLQSFDKEAVARLLQADPTVVRRLSELAQAVRRVKASSASPRQGV